MTTAGDSRGRSRRSLLKVFIRSGPSVVGLTILLFIGGTAAMAPWIAPYSATQQNLRNRFSPPAAEHLLGTDYLGRDILSRTLHGARVSLTVGVMSAAIAMVLGSALGIIAGFKSGVTDRLISQVTDILLSVPTLIMGLVVIAFFGPGLWNVIPAISITLVPRFIRVARGSTIAVREQDYIQASRALGERDSWIMLKHIVPNVAGPILVVGTLWVCTAILIEASLSFLGLGVVPPSPTWGNLIRDGSAYMLETPWLVIAPGVALTLTILALNMVGDGLRDVLDPRSLTRQ